MISNHYYYYMLLLLAVLYIVINLGVGAIAGGATRLNVPGGGTSNFSGNCLFNGKEKTFGNNNLINK